MRCRNSFLYDSYCSKSLFHVVNFDTLLRHIDIKSRFLKNEIVILKRIMMPRLWEWKTIKGDIFNTQNWPYAEINDEFICPNHKRLGFKRYAYRHNRYEFKRDFKLYECDDCSACPLRNQCMKSNSKVNKKIMRNYT